MASPYDDLAQSVQDLLTSSPGSGIIYCFQTKECEVIKNLLLSKGINAAAYYAKGAGKSQALADWETGKIPVMVATVRLC